MHTDPGARAKPIDRRRASSFGAAAEHYDRYRPSPPAAAVEWALPAHCAAVLDLGAGTGALTRRLVDRVPSVVAVEPDERMRAVLRARLGPEIDAGRLEVRAGHAERIPLPDACVDAVLGSSVWHWVDPAIAVPEVARVLRPGGVLALLWNGPDRTVPWVARLMAGGRGASPERIDQLEQRRRRRRDVRLPPGSPFATPDTTAIEWTRQVTPDELVGLVGTYSEVLVMPEDERRHIVEQVEEFVRTDEVMAGHAEIDQPMRCDVWRAVRLP